MRWSLHFSHLRACPLYSYAPVPRLDVTRETRHPLLTGCRRVPLSLPLDRLAAAPSLPRCYGRSGSLQAATASAARGAQARRRGQALVRSSGRRFEDGEGSSNGMAMEGARAGSARSGIRGPRVRALLPPEQRGRRRRVDLASSLPPDSYRAERAKARKRDAIPDKTYLYWKLYDGGIVEAKSAGSSLNYLLSSSQSGAPEEPPRVMTIFDVVRTLKFIENDDRVVRTPHCTAPPSLPPQADPPAHSTARHHRRLLAHVHPVRPVVQPRTRAARRDPGCHARAAEGQAREVWARGLEDGGVDGHVHEPGPVPPRIECVSLRSFRCA